MRRQAAALFGTLRGAIRGRLAGLTAGPSHRLYRMLTRRHPDRALPACIDRDPACGRVNVPVDVNMMLMSPGGRERTSTKHRQPPSRPGLRIDRLVPTPSPLAIIEAAPEPGDEAPCARTKR